MNDSALTSISIVAARSCDDIGATSDLNGIKALVFQSFKVIKKW